MKTNMNLIAICVYNIALVAGTAYLVQAFNWSPWWFLLTAMFAGSFEGCKK